MYFFATLRLESISVRGMHSPKISTTETENVAFVLLTKAQRNAEARALQRALSVFGGMYVCTL